MDPFTSWISGKILDRVFAQITSKDLRDNLIDVIDVWAKDLPDELELHSSAIASALDNDKSDRPKLDVVLREIEKLRIPSSEIWLDFLMEHWDIVRDKIGNNAASFFLIDRHQANKHLSRLAECLSLECQKDESLYKGEILDSIKSLNPNFSVELATESNLGMMPPAPTLIVGREDDFDELRRRFGITGESAHPYTVVRGLPGVGKTTFAFALAHDEQVKAAFPDGVLWTYLDIVNRKKRDREKERTELINKLSDWGRVLGSNDVQLSRAPEDAAGKLRPLLNNKRMLLIVDDIWDSAHGEVFKVGGPGCVTLFTTRETKIAYELVDSSDNEIYLLGKLTDEKAHDLLQQLAPSVVKTYPQQCLELIHELEGLPLSIQVAGRMLNREAARGFSPADLIEEIIQGVRLLEANAPANRPGTEEDRSMLTVTVLLEKSTDRLDDETRLRFASLGPLAPKPATFDIRAMEAVWADDKSKSTVDELLDRGLLEPVTIDGMSRYQMHALLVMHAKEILKAL